MAHLYPIFAAKKNEQKNMVLQWKKRLLLRFNMMIAQAIVLLWKEIAKILKQATQAGTLVIGVPFLAFSVFHGVWRCLFHLKGWRGALFSVLDNLIKMNER